MKKSIAKILALFMAASMIFVLFSGCNAEVESLNVNVGPEPNTIDPQLNTAVDGATLINHAFEGLMKMNAEKEIVFAQAESCEISDDELVYTFTLRDDIKWSDGQPVKAGDFVYAWQRLVDPDTASEYNYIIDMVLNANEVMAGEKDPSELGIKALDDKTLEITLAVPCAYFYEICAFPAGYPVRQDIVEGNDQWTQDPKTYVSNGPYVLSKWEHNSYMLYVQNKEYYGQSELVPEAIKFVLMDDANAVLAAYKTGELLLGDTVPPEEVQALKDSGDLHIDGQIGTYMVCFNTEVEPFDDARVRKAFNLVIDREFIIDNIAQGNQVPADAYVPYGLSDTESTEDFREVGGTYWDPAAYEANCEEARQLLAEAGYPGGEGFPQVEYMTNTDDLHSAIGEALQQMWQEELGVTATLSNQDWSVFIDTRQNGEFEIVRNGWLADYNDPISFLDMWLTDGGNNDAQYSNPKYDALIQQVKASSDREERMTLMHQAEDILMEDMPIAPIFFNTDLYVMSPKLEGFYSNPLGFKYFMYSSVAE